MPRSYSQDLRDRVIRAVIEEGLSRRTAAARFGVSESSAIKWVRRFELHGSKAPAGTGGHRPSKIKPHQDWVLDVLETHKDITLEALARMMADDLNVRVDTGMLSRFFKSAGISFKKKRFAK
jgi:transposase